ncbi:MAG: diguanylate cyclase [Gemmatimonadales bacterium]
MAQNMRVLVADDDQSLVRTLTWILKEHGYEVAVCPGGDGLFARLEEVKPALLLLDIMMPKVDGLTLLERLKQDDRWRDLPVLMVSSMPPEEATVRALGLGASDFIAKPFRVRELLARVEAHIRVGRALAQAREEAKSRAAMVDILHEVTDSLKPDEIYHILARRVARALNISKCSMVLAKPGDQQGIVVAAYENPMLRNLQIELAKYPEIRKAVSTGRLVLVQDVATDPLYAEERKRWEGEDINVPTRSAIALPFVTKGEQRGVFFLRTTGDDPPLTAADAQFAETVIKTAVSAIEKAYDFESAVSDKQRLEKLAQTDALTGLTNRRGLAEALEQELDRARRYSLALTILLADIDRFKQVNDTRGHIVGDSVLRQVGELLRREARSVDIVARYGGEEFVVVMPETAPPGAAIFAERLRMRVAKRDFADPGEDPLRVTVSIGLATFPDDRVHSADNFVSLADQALYRAKNEGRNLVRQ